MPRRSIQQTDRKAPRVGIIMGSQSDWPVMKSAAQTFEEFGVGYEAKIMSAHRTPDRVMRYIGGAKGRGLQVIIAAAGGAAHLAGVAAAFTTLPVLGVPMESASLKGMDSLLSMVQMPAGIPVGTLAIGRPGATNAALLAVAILALGDKALADRLEKWRATRAAAIPEEPKDE